MSDIQTTVDKWLLSKHLKTCDLKNNLLNIHINGIDFIIRCPKNDETSYTVHKIDSLEDEIISEINIYCVKNKPNIIKVLNIIYKNLHKIKKSHASQDDMPDKHKYKKHEELKKMIPTSFTNINTNNMNNNKKQNKIFSENIVCDIVINEFINVSSAYEDKIIIEIPNNNIFNWRLKYKKFDNININNDLKALKRNYKYDYIEIDLNIHGEYYPNYPPVIKVLRPRLENRLMEKLSNIRYLQLDYWTPAKNMKKVVDKLYEILDKHCEINANTDLNDAVLFPDGAYTKFESMVIDLAPFIETEHYADSLDSTEKKNTKPISDNMKAANTVWKAGTGYGSSICDTKLGFDMNTHVKAQNMKNDIIENMIKQIITYMQDMHVSEHPTLSDSLLMKYIKVKLSKVSVLDITIQHSLYKTIFDFLLQCVYVFVDTTVIFNSIYDEIEQLCITCKKYKESGMVEIAEENIFNTITMICEIIGKPKTVPSVDANTDMMDTGGGDKDKDIPDTKIEHDKDKPAYTTTMKKLKDITGVKIIDTNYHYQDKFKENINTTLSAANMRFLRSEIYNITAGDTLPIEYDSMIITRKDSSYITALRTLITGPKDTPYECGCFLFDTYITTDYPQSPPLVNFINHGDKRFNPNLYSSGKVCLSVLGTWQGDKSESWIPKVSTLAQIYISIQGQILVDEPYYNEPGYEKHNSAKKSTEYNENIRLYTMKHAIYDLMISPSKYDQFSDVILSHFRLKKTEVLKICKKWCDILTNDSLRVEYTKTYDSIVRTINNL